MWSLIKDFLSSLVDKLASFFAGIFLGIRMQSSKRNKENAKASQERMDRERKVADLPDNVIDAKLDKWMRKSE